MTHVVSIETLKQKLEEGPAVVFDIREPGEHAAGVIAGALLQRGGYDHVRIVEGGMSEWARRGWPLVKPGG